MSSGATLIYLMKRDLRATDNPILYGLSTTEHGFTHLLSAYIFPSDHIEVSGLVKDGNISPYLPTRYGLSRRWRCSHLCAKFIAGSLWDLKRNLENLGSGFIILVGTFDAVLNGMIGHSVANQDGPQITAVWMIVDYSPGQQREEETISAICGAHGIKFDWHYDVKYCMHDLHFFEVESGIDCLPVSGNHHELQPYLALGCITTWQVHQGLLELECGADPNLAQTRAFRRSCGARTESIRYHMLVANFIRLSLTKHGSELYKIEGAGMGKTSLKTWKSSAIQELDRPGQVVGSVVSMIQLLMGLTGFSLVDASQLCTRGEGVARGFFAWYGAEYVSLLSTDHDPLLHFYRQKRAGVGPSYEAQGYKISPAKVSRKVSLDGIFFRRRIPELRNLPRKKNVFQVNATASSQLQQCGLASSIMVTHDVPCTMAVDPTTETTNANRAQVEDTVALARREGGSIHIADIPKERGAELEAFGSGFGIEVPRFLEAPLGLPEPTELPQGPPPRPRGAFFPFRSGRAEVKAQVASTAWTPTPPAEATVLWNGMILQQRNTSGHHPGVALPSPSHQQTSDPLIRQYIKRLYLQRPPAQLPQPLPAQPSICQMDIPASQLSNKSYHVAASLRPQSLPPPLPAPVDAYIPPLQQRNLSGNQNPTRILPYRPAAPSPPSPSPPPPPPPPTLSSAIPHRFHAPQVSLPRDEPPRVSLEGNLPPVIMIPLRRGPRRLRPRIAVIPHPALAGFLPVVAELEIIRYYITQLRQTRFRESSSHTLIDLPFLDSSRMHIVPCPRGVVPLRGDPDFDIFREPPPSAAPEDVDLDAFDELIDEVEDDEAAFQGTCIRHGRRDPRLLRPYRGPRHPFRFNSRYR
ncbi:uncharacterized protein TrAFT101_000627 [Trichoderma asperellum]|uniref:uncharacterized protein n=1 Tax=Trichoderma asperellum TaxID=101201 RepID=UPI0033190EEA|nr:hypothetical protein TrAFT101_000627 [Trichoderma asperellum]